MQAGGRRLAASPETGDRAAPGRVDGDAAHVIMRCRPHRDRLARGIESGGVAARGDRREARGKALAERTARIEEDAMPVAEMPPDGARHHIARLELGGEALAGFVDEHRAFAAHRLAHQRHRVEADIKRGGMELNEFHVGQQRAGARGERQSLAKRAERVGGVAIEPADAAGGDHHAARRQQHAPHRSRGKDARDATLGHHQAARLDAIEHGDRRRASDRRDQRAHDLAAAAVAAGMHDTAPAMRGFEAQREAAIGAAIEGDAVPHQRRDGRRRRCGDALDHRGVAEPVPGRHCVGGVQQRLVVIAQRGGDAALGEGAGDAGAERRPGEDDDRLGGEMQGRHQPGETRADDDRTVGAIKAIHGLLLVFRL